MTPNNWTFERCVDYGFTIHHVWYDEIWNRFPWGVLPPIGYIIFCLMIWLFD